MTSAQPFPATGTEFRVTQQRGSIPIMHSNGEGVPEEPVRFLQELELIPGSIPGHSPEQSREGCVGGLLQGAVFPPPP